MAKYTDKQKLDAVKAYKKGEGGLRAADEPGRGIAAVSLEAAPNRTLSLFAEVRVTSPDAYVVYFHPELTH